MESTREGALISQHSTLRESFLASDIEEKCEETRNSNANPTTSLAGLTLAAVLNNDGVVSQSTVHAQTNQAENNNVVRTLLDIIGNDETLSNTSSHVIGKKSWRSFKDRLKLKRVSAGGGPLHWRSSVPVPQSDIDIPNSRSPQMSSLSTNRSMRNSLRNSSIWRGGSFNSNTGFESVPADDMALRGNESGEGGGSMRLSAALAAEREETRRRLSRELVRGEDAEEENSGGAKDGDGEEDGEDVLDGGAPLDLFAQSAQQPMRMSLMDLLEETDRQAGIEGLTYRINDEEEGEEEDEEEEEEEEEEDVKGKSEYSCCVCMVRHKGAAFIPCGHTFCRLCSRELWVQRGNCPLCNGFILEILDIF